MLSFKATLILLSIGLTLLTVVPWRTLGHDAPEADVDLNDLGDGTTKSAESNTASAKDSSYTSPKINPDGVFLFENFDNEHEYNNKWIQSSDPKYSGKWEVNSGPDRPYADQQLLLPLKARHYAISAKLNQPFKFSKDKPLIVQYEAQFRDGLDCGGAYVKLLRNSAMNDLNKLTDKTPFSIMFGPDKCGSESKMHFIVQYLNPKTHEYSEKHWKQAKYVNNLMSAFSDKKHHLFKLVLESSNNFEIFLDDKSVGKGNLLEDLDPAINPPKEIIDPDDKKPADWDERPQIEDPNATKPDDWDEDAPKTIEDPNATKPSDWLEDEPKFIADPQAKKPDDWEDMDGDWEAPQIENPACAKVSGCGEWVAPMIANPSYKGKWKPPKIDNPNYKGKWEARKIPNPDYFYDEKPFSSLDAIGGIAFELWSMADNIAFDNLIITSNPEAASLVQLITWQDKKLEADASSPSLLTRSMHYLKIHPWLWAAIVLAVALPLFLFISYCCDTKKSRRAEEDATARRKKADESRPDDAKVEEEEEEEEAEEVEDEDEKEVEAGEEDEEEEADEEREEDEEEKGAGDKTPKRPVRQRKK